MVEWLSREQKCLVVLSIDRVLSGGGGDQGMFPPKKTCSPPPPPKIIIWQNYTGIALCLIILQVLESLVVLLKYMMRVLKAKAGL